MILFRFCHKSVNTGKENWRALLRDEVLNAKINENTEPREKMICQDSDSEKDDCVDHQPVQPRILSLPEAIGTMDGLTDFAEKKASRWISCLVTQQSSRAQAKT